MMQIHGKRIWEMVYNNWIVVTLLLVLITVCLVLTGSIGQKQQKSQEQAEEFESQYGENSYYWVTEALDDQEYYTYMLGDYDGNWYDRLSSLKQKLWNEEQFTFYTCYPQPIDVRNKMQDIFLDGYEMGDTTYDVSEREGEKWYLTKALLVSHNFFESNHVDVKSGRKFEEEDYQYKENENVPILLGSAYEKYYDINDCLQVEYLGKNMTLQVIGFLDNNIFFLSSSQNDFVSVERYIILPALQITEKTEFSKILSLLELNGTIQSKIGINKTKQVCQEILEQQGLTWTLNIHDSENTQGQSVVKKYSRMTNQVAKQFNILVILVVVFTVVALLLNIFSILQKNKYAFGVELLCGASYKDIFIEGFAFVLLLLCIGDLWASIISGVMNSGIKSMLLIQIVVGVISIITFTGCYCYMKRMQIGEIIGGTE